MWLCGMLRVAYTTDLMHNECALIELYVRTNGYGRPPLPNTRELLNAIFLLGAGG
jgi:hypothetical protein